MLKGPLGLEITRGLSSHVMILEDHKHPQSSLYTKTRVRHTSLNTIMHAMIYQRSCEPQASLIPQTSESQTGLLTIPRCLGNRMQAGREKFCCLSNGISKNRGRGLSSDYGKGCRFKPVGEIAVLLQ